jgi:peptidyl-prolyl cis-trans isomerase C
MFRRLPNEPFVHFLVLGFLIFGAYLWLNPKEQERGEGNADDRIVIDQQQVDHLKELWSGQWKREPDAGELRAILDRHLRQEIFYREALRMGLDRNDEIIKRRLSQKMEAVADDLGALMRPPTDAQLEQYFHEHADFFTVPRSYALRQVLFLPDETNLEAGMNQTLDSLRRGADLPSQRMDKLGVPCDWPLTSVRELENAFGEEFTRVLDRLPVNEWAGPVRSGYGQHLVFILSRQEPALPRFDDVRDLVAREYKYRSELKSQEAVFEELLAKYKVSITAQDIPEEVKSSFVSQ